jgi:hypothetical protein
MLQRIQNAANLESWAGFTPAADFTETLNGIVAVAREQFGGAVSYASGDWEEIDWTPFDFAAVDMYRTSDNADHFAETVRKHAAHGKPLVITEFGCCTYRGAAEAGGMGWAIMDFTTTPRTLNNDYVRDESVQVAYFHELMDVFEAEHVHGAFWFTFAGYELPYHPDPHRDLDMASYGVVKIVDGVPERKAVFEAIATRFA